MKQEDFIRTIENTQDLKEIKKLYKYIQTLMREERYIEYSNLMEKVDISKLYIASIIGMLRLTNPYRNKIPYWGYFLDKAIVEIDSRGESSLEVLWWLI